MILYEIEGDAPLGLVILTDDGDVKVNVIGVTVLQWSVVCVPLDCENEILNGILNESHHVDDIPLDLGIETYES